jgi:hypothetical protein
LVFQIKSWSLAASVAGIRRILVSVRFGDLALWWGKWVVPLSVTALLFTAMWLRWVSYGPLRGIEPWTSYVLLVAGVGCVALLGQRLHKALGSEATPAGPNPWL